MKKNGGQVTVGGEKDRHPSISELCEGQRKCKESKNPTVEEHPSAETRSRSRPTPWNLTLPYNPPHAHTNTHYH